MTAVRTRILDGFDDPRFGPEQWEALLGASRCNLESLTWHWQRTWWKTWGRGELLLILAQRHGEPVALAPFYTNRGMVSCVGYTNTDYVDFIGDIGDPEVLAALLGTAREHVAGFVGFTLYYLRDRSGTGRRLPAAAARLGLSCYEEDALPAPAIDLGGRPEAALAAANRESLRRHERSLRREGTLEVRHLVDGDTILPHLPEFFAQHIARWADTPTPSKFLDERHRRFVERVTTACGRTGWLRFTRLDWNGRPIAFHYGSCYRGRYYFGTSSFAIDLARRSLGEVLLRQLFLAAIEEGATMFDFGFGYEQFKFRFATDVDYVRGYGLYQRRRSPEVADLVESAGPGV